VKYENSSTGVDLEIREGGVGGMGSDGGSYVSELAYPLASLRRLEFCFGVLSSPLKKESGDINAGSRLNVGGVPPARDDRRDSVSQVVTLQSEKWLSKLGR
jgi:hypothetical protein